MAQQTNEIYAVGVDNGGTWIRLKGMNANGRCVWSLKKHSPTVKKLPSFLHKHLQRFDGELSLLAVGSRGVWKIAERRSIQRRLSKLAKKVTVQSDVEAAWMAAFKKQGIIVIAGTGSIAYGRTSSGKSARAGGLGPDKGDEGSGYWIGKEWLRRSQQRSQGPVRKIASLTPFVIQKAKSGYPIAMQVIQEAQDQLADLVVQLTRKLSWRGRVPLSVSGSVLENKGFRSGFFKSLKERKIRFQYISKHMDPAVAIISHVPRRVAHPSSRPNPPRLPRA